MKVTIAYTKPLIEMTVRYSTQLPAVGDQLYFSDVFYTVRSRVWEYVGSKPHIAIHVTPTYPT